MQIVVSGTTVVSGVVVYDTNLPLKSFYQKGPNEILVELSLELNI